MIKPYTRASNKINVRSEKSKSNMARAIFHNRSREIVNYTNYPRPCMAIYHNSGSSHDMNLCQGPMLNRSVTVTWIHSADFRRETDSHRAALGWTIRENFLLLKRKLVYLFCIYLNFLPYITGFEKHTHTRTPLLLIMSQAVVDWQAHTHTHAPSNVEMNYF